VQQIRWGSGEIANALEQRTYAYDGSDNIVNVGSDYFLYDYVGRMTAVAAFTGDGLSESRTPVFRLVTEDRRPSLREIAGSVRANGHAGRENLIIA
jgi:hypothetical protein